jgi:hypothetical protein
MMGLILIYNEYFGTFGPSWFRCSVFHGVNGFIIRGGDGC